MQELEEVSGVAAPFRAQLSSRSVALRLSVTDRCQLRCRYCRPGQSGRPALCGEPLGGAEFARFVQIAQRHFGVAKVRITGGEPLLRPDILDVVRAISDLEVPDLALTTNALRLAELAGPLRAAGLHRVSVSLDSLREDTFRAIAGTAGRDQALAGISAALSAGLRPLKLNTVVMRGVNDDEATALIAFALEHDCELRFIELMPTGLDPDEFSRLHVPAAELIQRLSEELQTERLPYERGSSSRRYRVAKAGSAHGVFGVITPMSHPFCSGCRRLRLTSDGKLVGCLGRRETWSIAELLRTPGEKAEAAVAAAMETALGCKRTSVHFEPAMRMSSLGG